MWIRSQDKTMLIDASYFEVVKGTIYAGTGIEGTNFTGNKEVASYNSEERAMEVLDEIQKRLVFGTQFEETYTGKKTIKDFVYQMPEK